jgi:hypothetical protein
MTSEANNKTKGEGSIIITLSETEACLHQQENVKDE